MNLLPLLSVGAGDSDDSSSRPPGSAKGQGSHIACWKSRNWSHRLTYQRVTANLNHQWNQHGASFLRIRYIFILHDLAIFWITFQHLASHSIAIHYIHCIFAIRYIHITLHCVMGHCSTLHCTCDHALPYTILHCHTLAYPTIHVYIHANIQAWIYIHKEHEKDTWHI